MSGSAEGIAFLKQIKKNLEQGKRQWRRGDFILEAFGYRRRRSEFVQQVNAALEELGMVAIPPIDANLNLEGYTVFRLAESSRPADAGANADPPPQLEEEPVTGPPPEEIDQPPVTDPISPADLSLTVKNLDSATTMPLWVSPNETIAAALTEMQIHDYSQLVVATSPRSVKGIVSYKSIARTQLQSSPKTVQECLDVTVPVVTKDAPLLDVISHFQRHDCVLVMDEAKVLCGLVTPADVATEFRLMAGPFLVIGEIEEHLRWFLRRVLRQRAKTLADLIPALRDGVREVDELTMGELELAFQHPDQWGWFGIRFDRAVFCRELGEVRLVRNGLMHFREPVNPERLDRLRAFAELLRDAAHAAVR